MPMPSLTFEEVEFKFTVPEPNTGCWLWIGNQNKRGYGMVRVKDPGNRKNHVGAHRYFYEYFKGPIPIGLEIDHLCKNRSCVNPNHLEAVTHSENIKRTYFGNLPRKLSPRLICRKGIHVIKGANEYIAPSSGKRLCKLCNNEGQRIRWRLKRHA